MNAYEQLRIQALALITGDTPLSFWRDLRPRSQLTYADTFEEVKLDTKVHPDQKIDALLQLRHFRMESLLVALANEHGLSNSMSLIVENSRRHAYVFKNGVALTQSYVQRIGALPQPAKFRERLARNIGLPRLDLGDEPPGAFDMPQLYGLIAHNPIGRRFREDEQKLGMIQLCLPSADCKVWAIEVTIAEILDAYAVAPRKSEQRRSPTWRRKDDRGTGTGEDK